MFELAYWYSLLLLESMMTATSTSQRTLNSYAFFSSPAFRLLKVIYRRVVVVKITCEEVTVDVSTDTEWDMLLRKVYYLH